ncbi:MAG TPA: hypothetical protein VFH92_01325 [Phenylobacterium sp.]|nr:hypothetical protein [Phenylobacterium sp.]
MAMPRREAKAAEYHGLALAAASLAASSLLDAVREKHEVAAARWLALAAMNERPIDAPPADPEGETGPGFALPGAEP